MSDEDYALELRRHLLALAQVEDHPVKRRALLGIVASADMASQRDRQLNPDRAALFLASVLAHCQIDGKVDDGTEYVGNQHNSQNLDIPIRHIEASHSHHERWYCDDCQQDQYSREQFLPERHNRFTSTPPHHTTEPLIVNELWVS